MDYQEQGFPLIYTQGPPQMIVSQAGPPQMIVSQANPLPIAIKVKAMPHIPCNDCYSDLSSFVGCTNFCRSCNTKWCHMCNTDHYFRLRKNGPPILLMCGPVQQYVCDFYHSARFNTEGRVRNRSCCYCLSAILACLFYPVYGIFLSLPAACSFWSRFVSCFCSGATGANISAGNDCCGVLLGIIFLCGIYLASFVPIYVGTFVYLWGLLIYDAFKFRTVPVIRLPKGHREDEQIE